MVSVHLVQGSSPAVPNQDAVELVQRMHAIPANLFADLGLIFGCTVVLALLFIRLQLPAVLAYLGAGIVLGPSVLGLVERTEYIDVLAEVGVILLLFTVGLEFSLSEIGGPGVPSWSVADSRFY